MSLKQKTAFALVGCILFLAGAAAKPGEATTSSNVGRVTGIGGIFFKAKDPKKLKQWYVDQLGLPGTKYGVKFDWRRADAPDQPASTSWATFPQTTTYFDPTAASFMVDYRVDNLDAVLARLRAAGVHVDSKIEAADYGRFGWAVDPEGNRFELWEPKPGS